MYLKLSYGIVIDFLEGLLHATPKRRTQIRVKWREKYGDDNWTHGTKLWKPKKNIVTCPECGSFHEVHTICRECFKKTNKLNATGQSGNLWFDSNLAQPKNPSSNNEQTSMSG